MKNDYALHVVHRPMRKRYQVFTLNSNVLLYFSTFNINPRNTMSRVSPRLLLEYEAWNRQCCKTKSEFRQVCKGCPPQFIPQPFQLSITNLENSHNRLSNYIEVL